MDKREALKITREFMKQLRRKYNFNKVFLFGSYAKGGFNQDSDIDIAVVFNDFKDRTDMQVEMMRLGFKIDSRLEPHPFREKDFEPSDPLVYEIMKYGQEVVANR